MLNEDLMQNEKSLLTVDNFRKAPGMEDERVILEMLRARNIRSTADFFDRKFGPRKENTESIRDIESEVKIYRESAVESERSVVIQNVCETGIVDEEIKPSVITKNLLDKVSSSDLTKLLDSKLVQQYPNALKGFDGRSFGYQLVLGTLDNTDLKTSDLVMSIERNFGTNMTYSVLNDFGLFTQSERIDDSRRTREASFLDDELSGGDLAQLLGYI